MLVETGTHAPTQPHLRNLYRLVEAVSGTETLEEIYDAE